MKLLRDRYGRFKKRGKHQLKPPSKRFHDRFGRFAVKGKPLAKLKVPPRKKRQQAAIKHLPIKKRFKKVLYLQDPFYGFFMVINAAAPNGLSTDSMEPFTDAPDDVYSVIVWRTVVYHHLRDLRQELLMADVRNAGLGMIAIRKRRSLNQVGVPVVILSCELRGCPDPNNFAQSILIDSWQGENVPKWIRKLK